MSASWGLSPDIVDYLYQHNPAEPDLFRRLREETQAKTKIPQMQISWEQAAFMQFQAQLINAQRYLEIGVFTGFSTLAMATAMSDDAEIIACDVSAEWTAMGQRYWQEAGIDHKIDLRLAPALETMDRLIADGQSGTFDICFIDADKENYGAYYERALQLLRSGGLIMVDNVLWMGWVVDPKRQDDDTKAIRVLNDKIAKDGRVHMTMTAVGDGVTLAMKR